MKHLQRIAQLVFDTPLAIHPPKLEAILSVLGPRLGVDIDFDSADALKSLGADSMDMMAPKDRMLYAVNDDGVACIPIQGTLMKKAYGLWAMSGCSSYELIEQQVTAALKDSSVKALLFEVDSPGGETHGVFELSDLIYSMRGEKPMCAIADDAALSAAYALASAADEVWVTRTGAVGSIGVYALHVDQSGYDEKMGAKYTYIYAGDKKIDGNPHEPLSRSAKSDAQKEVDREYAIFCQTVARNRGASVKEITATEAGVAFADTAVPLLADKVGTFDEALAALTMQISPSRSMVSMAGTRPAQIKSGGKEMPAIPPHRTATVKKAWDGPANKRRLRADADQSYYEKAFAFRHADANPQTKTAYSFIHHEVAANGDVGAANLKGCSTGIGIVNGGRGGQGRRAYTSSERRGIYRHLAKHLRDGGETPPDFQSNQQLYEFGRAAAQLCGDDPKQYEKLMQLAAGIVAERG